MATLIRIRPFGGATVLLGAGVHFAGASAARILPACMLHFSGGGGGVGGLFGVAVGDLGGASGRGFSGDGDRCIVFAGGGQFEFCQLSTPDERAKWFSRAAARGACAQEIGYFCIVSGGDIAGVFRVLARGTRSTARTVFYATTGVGRRAGRSDLLDGDGFGGVSGAQPAGVDIGGAFAPGRAYGGGVIAVRPWRRSWAVGCEKANTAATGRLAFAEEASAVAARRHEPPTSVGGERALLAGGGLG